jgi:AcrR family transcriptional regulator
MSSTEELRSARMPRQMRRALLLEAARDAFVQSGYHAAGMDDIAERAGVSKPVLYQHFPGKMDLYLAVLEASSDSLVKRVDAALASTTDNKARVYATIDAYFSFVADEAAAFRLLFESDLTNDPHVVAKVSQTDEICAARISEVIAEDTGLSADDAFLLASGLTGMAQTAARRWLRDGGVTPRQEAALKLSALAWRGISGFPLTHPPVQTKGTAVPKGLGKASQN